MRLSTRKQRYDRITRTDKTSRNVKFIQEDVYPHVRAGGGLEPWLCFVGGGELPHLAVREAQRHLRLDRTPSPWSHVGVVLHWPAEAPSTARDLESVVGVQASPWPRSKAALVPERNGVTFFTLSEFADGRRFPNLAFARLPLQDSQENDLLTAALDPTKDRMRFPLWEWLGKWAGYLHDPESATNPLREGVPHPGAAFCEYLFESVGVQVAPGLTAPNTSPEHIWSAVSYWDDLQDSDAGPNAPRLIPEMIRDRTVGRREYDDRSDASRDGSRAVHPAAWMPAELHDLLQ